MTKKLEKRLKAKVLEISHQSSAFVAAFCEGAGLMMVGGIAWVADLEIDLRFENLPPTIRQLK